MNATIGNSMDLLCENVSIRFGSLSISTLINNNAHKVCGLDSKTQFLNIGLEFQIFSVGI